MWKINIAVILSFLFVGCVSRPAVDVWGDAGLVAEQRAAIEQQRRTLADMGGAIGQVQSGLGAARTDFERA